MSISVLAAEDPCLNSLQSNMDVIVNAKSDLVFFLQDHSAVRASLVGGERSSLNLFPPTKVKLTVGEELEDTYLLAKLVARALEKLGPKAISTILDLESRSSLATAYALERNPKHKDLQVLALGHDRQSLMIGQANVGVVGPGDRYRFLQMDMLDFIEAYPFKKSNLIVAAPPAVPYPRELDVSQNRKWSGGLDGTRYIKKILQAQMEPGTHVVLFWPSLSHPLSILPQIHSEFEILYIEATETSMGRFTKDPELFQYLNGLRNRGEVIFDDLEADGLVYNNFGMFLKKRTQPLKIK